MELNFEEDDRNEEDCDAALGSGASSIEIDEVPAIVGLESI